jgi:hypothetical protein
LAAVGIAVCDFYSASNGTVILISVPWFGAVVTIMSPPT